MGAASEVGSEAADWLCFCLFDQRSFVALWLFLNQNFGVFVYQALRNVISRSVWAGHQARRQLFQAGIQECRWNAVMTFGTRLATVETRLVQLVSGRKD